MYEFDMKMTLQTLRRDADEDSIINLYVTILLYLYNFNTIFNDN